MMNFLNTPRSFVPDGELCGIKKEKYQERILRFKKENPGKKVGTKCPRSAEQEGFFKMVDNQYGERVKYVVGVRHPINWFESFYNFRINNVSLVANDGINFRTFIQLHFRKIKKGDVYPPAQELIGGCGGLSPPLCTDRARFSHFLARMGKTSLSTEEELSLITNGKLARSLSYNSKNKVFFYTVDQLGDKNETRSKLFEKDLSNFIGIPVPEESVANKKRKPGIEWDEAEQKRRDELKINICDDVFKDLRKVLLEEGIKSQQWIIDYFFKSNDVFVSSRDYVVSTLKKWNVDPCLAKIKET